MGSWTGEAVAPSCWRVASSSLASPHPARPRFVKQPEGVLAVVSRAGRELVQDRPLQPAVGLTVMCTDGPEVLPSRSVDLGNPPPSLESGCTSNGATG